LPVIAPAKINLFLHVTGKNDIGYHLLQSLVAFADVGDRIEIAESEQFSLTASGPFAAAVETENNSVLSAVRAMHDTFGTPEHFAIKLEKNIPAGAGLGGGSADAAAIVRALIEMYRLTPDEKQLDNLLLSLGADVPVCFKARSVMMEGIGEILSPCPLPGALPAVLVYPGMPCPTGEIFQKRSAGLSAALPPPGPWDSQDQLIKWLNETKNDLSDAALPVVPEIKTVLDALSSQEGFALGRMSGSGSACFGLFENEKAARTAAENLKAKNPGWWVQAVTINSPM
jgi:4-diphosphocytidyl-2-C-methyl-D-erythritol kinase